MTVVAGSQAVVAEDTNTRGTDFESWDQIYDTVILCEKFKQCSNNREFCVFARNNEYNYLSEPYHSFMYKKPSKFPHPSHTIK